MTCCMLTIIAFNNTQRIARHLVMVAKHLLQHHLMFVHQLTLMMTFQGHGFCKSCRRKVWIQALMIVWMQVLQVDVMLVLTLLQNMTMVMIC